MVLFFLVTYAYRFYFLELVNQTLHVRIAGVDAPEVAFSLPFFGTYSLNFEKNHFIFSISSVVILVNLDNPMLMRALHGCVGRF